MKVDDDDKRSVKNVRYITFFNFFFKANIMSTNIHLLQGCLWEVSATVNTTNNPLISPLFVEQEAS